MSSRMPSSLSTWSGVCERAREREEEEMGGIIATFDRLQKSMVWLGMAMLG